MSFIEASFIPRQEFDHHEADRYQEEQLEADQLYSAMFALNSLKTAHEAATLPARMLDVARLRSGLHVIRIAILNGDLETTHIRDGRVIEGYWVDVNDKISIIEASTDKQVRIPISSCYFKSYGTDIDFDTIYTDEGLEQAEDNRVLTLA